MVYVIRSISCSRLMFNPAIVWVKTDKAARPITDRCKNYVAWTLEIVCVLAIQHMRVFGWIEGDDQGGPWAEGARVVMGKRGSTGQLQSGNEEFKIHELRRELPAIAPFLFFTPPALFLFTFPALPFLAFALDPGKFLGAFLFARVPFSVLAVVVGPSGPFIFVCLISPIVAVCHRY